MVAVNDHLLRVKVASYVRLNADLSSVRLCNLYDSDTVYLLMH